MKVLVTGATGFVGRHIIPVLLELKYKVIATSIESDEEAKRFKWYNKVTYICKDLSIDSKENLFKLFKKPDAMIHLSWSGLPNYSSMHHIKDNLWHNYNFIEKMLDNGLRDLTVVGTCAEYGKIEGCVSEDMGTKPVTPYAMAKDSLRMFIEAKGITTPFNFRWIRLFYVYGEGQSHSSILSQLDVAIDKDLEYFDMSGGEQMRDYLPIDMAADSIAMLATQTNTLGIINCCSGVPVTVKSVVEERIKERGSDIKLNLGHYSYSCHEPMAFWGDSQKLTDTFDKELLELG